MGHWSGVAYTFKLNKDDKSYEEILVKMQEEIDQKYVQESKSPGESFCASMSIKHSKVRYSSSSYKSRVSNDLSYELIKKIQKNIDTDKDKYYYFQEDNGENKGAIDYLYGYAEKVGQYLLDAGWGEKYGSIRFYDVKKIDRFHDCIDNTSELEIVIKEGEFARLRREIFGNKNEINEYWIYKNKNPDMKESKEYVLDEKLLTYWLVYGTEDKYNTNFNYYANANMNLKEYLYALDYKYHDTHKGVRVLQDLTRYGILFKEGLESVEGNFKLGVRYDNSGWDIKKEQIESWYQENKAVFNEVPKITKNYANYLKEKYPETFLRLKTKLIELHNAYKALIEEKMKDEKTNPFSLLRKK